MDKKYTIKNIASMAGVSKGTVDRVLHNRGKVSSVALEKINEVLNVIDYEPNLIARNLKSNKIYRICVLLPNAEIDPYWLPCIEGIYEAKKEFKAYHNIEIKIHYFDPRSTEDFLEINRKIISEVPDAVLLTPLFQKEILELKKEYDTSRIMITTFNNQVKSTSINSFVGQDLFKSGRVAACLMNSILDKGQIAIVHIDESLKNAVHMQDKENGFRNYFEQKNNSDFYLSTLKLKSKKIETKFLSFLDKNSNLKGIFVTTSKAYQIASILASLEDKKIAVIGYDLVEKNIEFLNQGLINFLIHQNQKRQAYLGVSLLIEHFVFQKKIPETILLPIDIVNIENACYYI